MTTSTNQIFPKLKRNNEDLERSLTRKSTVKESLKLSSLQPYPLPCNGLKNIVLMDDQYYPIVTLKRAVHNIATIKENPDFFKAILEKSELNGRDSSAVEFTINNFHIEEYNIVEYTNDRCGFELINSIKHPDSGPINLAILDIILGASLLNDEDELVGVDGIDVAVEIRKKYPKATIMFNSGCVLGMSKESRKLEDLDDKIQPYSFSDKPFDNDLWLIDTAVALSQIVL